MNKLRILTILSLLFIAGTVFADGVVTVEPLTNIRGLEEAAAGGVNELINTLYTYLIGIGAISAVLIIMYGGFRYMTSEAVGEKNAGREDIQRAVLGLLLLLSPVIVFGIINEDILDLDLNLTRLEYTGSNSGFGQGDGTGGLDGACTPFPVGETVIGSVYDNSTTPDPTIAPQRQCCSEQANCELQSQRRGGNHGGRTEYSCSCEEVLEPITGYFWKGRVGIDILRPNSTVGSTTPAFVDPLGPVEMGPYETQQLCYDALRAENPDLRNAFEASPYAQNVAYTELLGVYVSQVSQPQINCEYEERQP